MPDFIRPSDIRWLHADVSQWSETSQITAIRFERDSLIVEHTKADQWPMMDDSGTAIEANPWVIAKIGDQWYAATYEWLRPGQTKKYITADSIGPHTKRAPLENWTPQEGEVVGFLISTPARDHRRTSNERSGIVLAKWGEGLISLNPEAPPAPPAAPTPPSLPPEPPTLPEPPPEAQILRELDAIQTDLRLLRAVMEMSANDVSDLGSGLSAVLARVDQIESTLLREANRLATEIITQTVTLVNERLAKGVKAKLW